MRQAVQADAEFLRVSNREDEFFVVQFGERPKLAVPLTKDIEPVRSAFLGARPIGRTSLLDAIEMSLAQMKRVNNTRKAMIILSDGGDNHSRATEPEIKKGRCVRPAPSFASSTFSVILLPTQPWTANIAASVSSSFREVRRQWCAIARVITLQRISRRAGRLRKPVAPAIARTAS
jgi:hypothetical protein